MGDETTTIEVTLATYQRLNARKLPSDSFDDVVSRVLDELDALSREVDNDREGERSPEHPNDEGRGPGDSGGEGGVRAGKTGPRPGGPTTEAANDTLDELLDELELPGGERRAEAVCACVEHLREARVASRSDFIEHVYPNHRTGVGEGRWWDVVGKQGLRTIADRHPQIEPPQTEGAHNYEWTGE